VTPFDKLFDEAEWKPTGNDGVSPDGIPYATHEGIIRLGGFELKCARLSTGQTVIDSDSLKRFLEFMNQGHS
jgi:hypothetical protein